MGQDAFGDGNGASRLGLNAKKISRDQIKNQRVVFMQPVFKKPPRQENSSLFEHLLEFFLEPFPSCKLPRRLD